MQGGNPAMVSRKHLDVLKELSSTLASVSVIEPQWQVNALLHKLKQLVLSSNTDVQFRSLNCIKRLFELSTDPQSFGDLKKLLLERTSSPVLRIRSASYDLLSLYVPTASTSALMDLCLRMQPFTLTGKEIKAFREDSTQCICTVQWLHRHRAALQSNGSTPAAELLKKLVSAYDQPRECTGLITDVRAAQVPHA